MSKSIKALAILGVVAGLGVAALPLSSYAAAEKHSYDYDTRSGASLNIGVTTEIKDYLSIESEDELDTEKTNYINLGTLMNNSDPIYTTDEGKTGATFNVKTNNENGYVVSISAVDTELKAEGVANGIAAGTPVKGSSFWGYLASSTASNVTVKEGTTYLGVSTTATELATGKGATSDAGDDITLDFGVSASASQSAGVYKGEVTLTATPGTATVGTPAD